MYSETHIDVFDCTTGDWLQTLNVKRAQPLNISGSLTSCIINDMPHVIYLSNLHQRKSLIISIITIQCHFNDIPDFLSNFFVFSFNRRIIKFDAIGCKW